jgi:hypothetical protein
MMVINEWILQVLCSAWKEDGSTVFSGGQAVTVGMHDAPIKNISWITEMNLLVTGSWDKTLKYVPFVRHLIVSKSDAS